MHPEPGRLGVLLGVPLERENGSRLVQETLVAVSQLGEARCRDSYFAPVMLLKPERTQGGGFREEVPAPACEVHSGHAHLARSHQFASNLVSGSQERAAMLTLQTHLGTNGLDDLAAEDSGYGLVAPADAQDLLRRVLRDQPREKGVDVQNPRVVLPRIDIAPSEDDQIEGRRVRELASVSRLEEDELRGGLHCAYGAHVRRPDGGQQAGAIGVEEDGDVERCVACSGGWVWVHIIGVIREGERGRDG